MSDALDYLVGDLVPAVRIRKIFIEESSNEDRPILVRVKLGLYIKKDQLLEKSWLANVPLPSPDMDASNILDAMFLRKARIFGLSNINNLRYSNQAAIENAPTGVHRASNRENSGVWMGHGQNPHIVPDPSAPVGPHDLSGHASGLKHVENLEGGHQGTVYGAAAANQVEIEDVSVKVGSIAGNLNVSALDTAGTAQDVLGPQVAEGKIFEEVKNGVMYYVIPFEDTYTLREGFNENGDKHLSERIAHEYFGVAYYCYLDVNSILDLGLDESVIQGQATSAIVFRDGQIPQTRQVLRDENGKVHHGDWHFHFPPYAAVDQIGLSGPAPDGYIGYMAGRSHVGSRYQPKLTLVDSPNYLITNARNRINEIKLASGVFSGVPGSVFQTKPSALTGVSVSVSDLQTKAGEISKTATAAVAATLAEAGGVGASATHPAGTSGFAGPFGMTPWEKSNKRNIVKDNDAEFSKLYLARSVRNEARGFFYIDVATLLKNQSKLFKNFGARIQNNFDNNLTSEVWKRSKILELRLYRERVEFKKGTEDLYKKFLQYKPEEEPKKLIGTLTQVGIGGLGGTVEGATSWSAFVPESVNGDKFYINATHVHAENLAPGARPLYVTFHDREVDGFASGLYMYSVEVDFQDGTPQFLHEHLQELLQIRLTLSQYLEFSKGSKGTVIATFDPNGESIDKRRNIPWYNRHIREFRPDFPAEIESINKNAPMFRINEQPVWQAAAQKIVDLLNLFVDTGVKAGLSAQMTQGDLDASMSDLANYLAAIASPYMEGSPEGIQYLLAMADETYERLSKLLRAHETASESSGGGVGTGDISTPNQLSVLPEDFYQVAINPARSIIYEKHEFDGPGECFRAVTNEYAYVDFLSLDEEIDISPTYTSIPGIDAGDGLLTLTPAYYMARCRMDSAKMSIFAVKDIWWEAKGDMGTNFTGNIHPYAKQYYNAQGMGSDDGALEEVGQDNWDSLSRTGYSYLTPSIINISDPGSGDNAYSFRYSVFRENVTDWLRGFNETYALKNLAKNMDNEDLMQNWALQYLQYSPLWKQDFYDFGYQDDVLLSMILYSNDTAEQNYIDMANPNFDISKWDEFKEEPDMLPGAQKYYNSKGLYNSFFSSHNIVVHSEAAYNDIFLKEAGATPFLSESMETWRNEQYGKTGAYFSDAGLETQVLFKNLIANPDYGTVFTKVPRGNHEPYNTSGIPMYLTQGGWSGYVGEDQWLGGYATDQGDTIKEWGPMTGYNEMLPNQFKLWYAFKKYMARLDNKNNPGAFLAGMAGSQDGRTITLLTDVYIQGLAVGDTWVSMLPDAYVEGADVVKPDQHANGFKFLNFNMTAKIEVFTGYGEMETICSTTGRVIKMHAAQDDRWALLTTERLRGASMGSYTTAAGGSGVADADFIHPLLCRISYFDPTLVGNVENIPVLNSYFFIDKSGAPVPPYVEPDFGDLYDQSPEEWYGENHEEVEEWITMLEKGQQSEGQATGEMGAFMDMGENQGGGTSLGVGIDIFGGGEPDPDAGTGTGVGIPVIPTDGTPGGGMGGPGGGPFGGLIWPVGNPAGGGGVGPAGSPAGPTGMQGMDMGGDTGGGAEGISTALIGAGLLMAMGQANMGVGADGGGLATEGVGMDAGGTDLDAAGTGMQGAAATMAGFGQNNNDAGY
mgnify:FL=1